MLKMKEVIAESSSVSIGQNEEMEFPPGFRFCPFSWELIQCYVKNKNDGVPLPIQIPVADIYECHPERLPVGFLVVFRQYKDQKGSRVKRSTDGGYWKTTSKDIEITDGENKKIGYLKKFKFMEEKGRNPRNWIMHEYRDLDTNSAKEETTSSANSSRISRYVMCKIYKVGKDPINSPQAIEYTETEIEFEGSCSIPQNHSISINGYHPHQTSSQNMNQFYDNEEEESSIPHTIPISSQSNEGGCLGGLHPTDSIDNVLEFPTSDASALLLDMNQFHDQFPEGPFYIYNSNLL
ncbi:hypothetical protein MRB53_021501 [Persea americana]|uniref:Uncharacterized protein n=1 Tax=Persea americana TaxID=3435 RepID=A0ACC2L424_PERAE|nr:hypothetical protein MRB53_021501 [Persea americana]